MSPVDKYKIQSGLEGINFTETKLSKVNGEKGELTIAGFPLEEIANKATNEEMMFLLWNLRLPTYNELTKLKSDLIKFRKLPTITIELLKAAVKTDVYPMDALRMAVSSITVEIGNIEKKGRLPDWINLGLQVVAKIPVIIATYFRLQRNMEIVENHPDLTHAANFLYLLRGSIPKDEETRALEAYLNTVSDHGMNASTFVARSIVSTDSDLISAICGAIGSLKGPKHGGAPGPVLKMINEIGEINKTESIIRRKLENKDLIMGFGHRVYKVRDPRAEVLSKASDALYHGEMRSFYTKVQAIEQIILQLIEEYKPGRNIKTNVEFYTSLILNGLDLHPDIYSSLFAMGRSCGWVAHIIEQYENNRIVRPRSIYTGSHDKKWVSIENR